MTFFSVFLSLLPVLVFLFLLILSFLFFLFLFRFLFSLSSLFFAFPSLLICFCFFFPIDLRLSCVGVVIDSTCNIYVVVFLAGKRYRRCFQARVMRRMHRPGPGTFIVD